MFSKVKLNSYNCANNFEVYSPAKHWLQQQQKYLFVCVYRWRYKENAHDLYILGPTAL